jgi:hypothetical protein
MLLKGNSMLIPVANCRPALYEALEFADNIKKLDELTALLFRLGHGYHNSGKEYICILTKDFAPYSFNFACYDIDDDNGNALKYITYKGATEVTVNNLKNPWMHGGLIYHGPHDNGGDGSAPTFSVNLTAIDGWSIHT